MSNISSQRVNSIANYQHLRNQGVLVTGGTGFIGRHLVRQLVAEGARVKVLVRPSSDLNGLRGVAENLEIVRGDLKAPNSLCSLMENVDIVFHLAATNRGTWEETHQAAVAGTAWMLEKARQRGVQHFIYVSSMAVYDYSRLPTGAVVDENAPLEPNPRRRTAYARVKCEVEALVCRWLSDPGMAVTVVRPGAVYGPGGPAHLPPAIRLVGSNLVFAIGGGQRQLPLLYVDDLADALLRIATAPAAAGKIYNVVSNARVTEANYVSAYLRARGRSILVIPIPPWPLFSVAWLYDLVLRLTGRNPESDLLRSLRRVTNRVFFSSAAIQKDLGWRARTGVDQGVQSSLGEVASAIS